MYFFERFLQNCKSRLRKHASQRQQTNRFFFFAKKTTLTVFFSLLRIARFFLFLYFQRLLAPFALDPQAFPFRISAIFPPFERVSFLPTPNLLPPKALLFSAQTAIKLVFIMSSYRIFQEIKFLYLPPENNTPKKFHTIKYNFLLYYCHNSNGPLEMLVLDVIKNRVCLIQMDFFVLCVSNSHKFVRKKMF